MNTTKAIAILKQMQEPEAWEPQITEEAFVALDMGIAALRKYLPDSTSKGDVIYRRAAISAVFSDDRSTTITQRLEALPSAQLEVIPVEWIQKYADDWQDMSYAYENPILGMLEDWRGEQEE